MLNEKNYYIVIIPYLTFCCGLYQITYWMLFNLNAFSLVSIQNVVMSSIVPLFFSLLAAGIGFFIANKLHPEKKHSKNVENPKDKDRDSSQKNKNSLSIFLLVLSLLVLSIGLFFLTPGDSYTAFAMICGMIFFVFTDINFVFAKDFNPKLDKRFLLMLMIYFPFISIAQALSEGRKIIENKSYQFTIIQPYGESNKTSDTLKLLGIADEKFVFTNLKNEKIYFIKSDTIILYKK